MSLDINAQGFGQNLNVSITGQGASVSLNAGGLNASASLASDQIATFKSDNPQISPHVSSNSSLPNTPVLAAASNTNSFSSQANEVIKNNNLPDGKVLSDQVSKQTKDLISNTIDDLQDIEHLDSEMKNFFNILAKLYPLSLALLQGILGGEGNKTPDEIAKQTLQILNELGKALSAHIDQSNLPQDVKDQLKNLASQLTNLGNSSDPSEVETLLNTLLASKIPLDPETKKLIDALKQLAGMIEGEGEVSFEPELVQQLNTRGLSGENQRMGQSELNGLMNQLQTSGTQGDFSKMMQSLATSLDLLQTLRGLPAQEKSLGLSTFLAMTNIESQTNSAGILGKSLGEFSTNAAKFILTIQEKGGNFTEALPKGPEGERLYSTAFSQVMLTAAVLGRMIAQSKALDMSDDAIKVAILKLNSAKDLGIVDQIPFSFMAFFADLRNKEDDLSDAVKAAKSALLELIRLLLKLTFILVVIASSGSKLGEKGMNLLLEENSQYITSILDAIIFALKKVDESYVVNVSFHTALLQKGKDALALKDYPDFWLSMIHMYAEKTELFQFLKDMEDAKPLFKTLEAMMSESKETLPVNFPIAT